MSYCLRRGARMSVTVPSATSAAKPSVSESVGCGWIVSAMSSATAPISIARHGLGDQLAGADAGDAGAQDRGGSRGRPAASSCPRRGRRRARGRRRPTGTPPSRSRCRPPWPASRSARSRRPRGPCRRRWGSTRASKTTSWPAMTSAATTPSCVALWASIGSPTTSPIAKMCGDVRALLVVDGDEAALVDRRRPAASAPTPAPLGRRPTATRMRSKTSVRRRRSRAGRRRPPRPPRRSCRCGRRRSAARCAWQRLDQVRVAARDELVGELDDGDLRAERVVDRRHLEADDAAADDEQPLAGCRAARARRWSRRCASSSGRNGRRRGLRARGDDRVVEGDRPRRRSTASVFGPVKRARRRAPTSTLRRLARPARPSVSLVTASSLNARTPSRSISGSPKADAGDLLGLGDHLGEVQQRLATGCSRRSGTRRRGARSARRARRSRPRSAARNAAV